MRLQLPLIGYGRVRARAIECDAWALSCNRVVGLAWPSCRLQGGILGSLRSRWEQYGLAALSLAFRGRPDERSDAVVAVRQLTSRATVMLLPRLSSTLIVTRTEARGSEAAPSRTQQEWHYQGR